MPRFAPAHNNEGVGGPITKRWWRALGEVFGAEIENRLPFQSKAKVYSELEADGDVVRVEMVLGGRFPVTIKGWALTERGRMLYCMSCNEGEHV